MPLPWLVLALPATAVVVGALVIGGVFMAKAKHRNRKDFRVQYRFVGVLGRGAFGRVYKIVARKDGHTYALKILELTAAKINVGAVEREIDLMRSLDHPNIIKYYTAYLAGPRVAIQMEFCPGGDLRRFLKKSKGRKLPYQWVHTWLQDLCSAVEYIHSKDVMHRDIKPENILLGRNYKLLLADFGIARMLTSGYAHSVRGTKSFMAPEAFQGRYDKKADIYSLGCVFVCIVSQESVPKKNLNVWQAVPKIYGETIFGIIQDSTCLDKDKRPSAGELKLRMCETWSTNL